MSVTSSQVAYWQLLTVFRQNRNKNAVSILFIIQGTITSRSITIISTMHKLQTSAVI